MWVLTRGAVETGAGEATTSPSQAQVWGLCRAVGLEHPEFWGGLVDLPAEFDARAGARLVSAFVDGREDQVAVRESAAFVRRLVRAEPRRGGGEDWVPRGTVLLTGVRARSGSVSGSGLPNAARRGWC